MFIAFEGIDGSGKTTLSKELYRFLLSRGIKTAWTKEPFKTEIRNFVLKNDLFPWEEVLLFTTDRSIHVREFVKPKLEEGFTVITDRFYLSTLAYQGFGKGLSLEELRKLHLNAVGNLKPHITFLLDIEPKKALERVKNRGNLSRFEKIEFLQKIREGFLKLAKEEPNVYILKGEKSIYELLGDILKVLNRKAEAVIQRTL